MDHLIHLLMREFIPEIEHRHKRQMLGMEGPNLAEKRHQQILMHAPKTPLERIKKIDNLCFEVQSSDSLKYYQVDLSAKTCTCIDFPNISLCKHIVSIVHFFGGADLGPQPPRNTSASESAEHKSQGQPISHGSADDDAVLLAANNIIHLSNQLISKAPRNTRIAKSLQMIESR